MSVSATYRMRFRPPLLRVACLCLFGHAAAAATTTADLADKPAATTAAGKVVDVQAPAPDPRKEIVCERWSQLPSRIISQRCYVKYTGADGDSWVDDGVNSLLTREELERWSENQEQYEQRQLELQRIYEQRCLEFGKC